MKNKFKYLYLESAAHFKEQFSVAQLTLQTALEAPPFRILRQYISLLESFIADRVQSWWLYVFVSFNHVYLLISFYRKAKFLVLVGMLLSYHFHPSSAVKSLVLLLPSSAGPPLLTFLLALWVECCESLNQVHPEQAILPSSWMVETAVITQTDLKWSCCGL